MWEVILLDEVDRWFMQLVTTDQEEAAAVAGAIDLLEQKDRAWADRPWTA